MDLIVTSKKLFQYDVIFTIMYKLDFYRWFEEVQKYIFLCDIEYEFC